MTNEIMKEFLAQLIADEAVKSDFKIGKVKYLEPIERKTQDGKPFTMISCIIEGIDGREYKKNFSVDFLREYLINQIGKDAESVEGTVCVFNVNKRFKSVSMIIFCEVTEDGELALVPYQETHQSYSDVFKKLGLLK